MSDTVGKETSNAKNVVPRLGGYHYEFQVGVLRLLDLIEGKADRVEFESASDKHDYFDDVKVFYNEHIHHYQVKWGLTRKPIRLNDFVNPSGSLYLLKLYRTWKSYSKKFTAYKHIFHVYSSKQIDSNEEILKYLEPARDEEKKFSDNKDHAFKLNTKVKELIKYNVDTTTLPDDIVSFLETLIVEVSQPNMPSSESEERKLGNPIKDMILEKISCRLGLNKFPSKLDPLNMFAMLINESYESAIQQRPITRSELAAKIGIKLDLSPMPQNFSFDKEHYIRTTKYFETLDSKFSTASGKMIGVVGLPGTGKSHLLTSWNNAVYDSGTNPIMYYCFIGHELHPDKRVTQNQLLQDLINSILAKYPDLASKEKHSLLAATPKRLNDLLSVLGGYARSNNQTIPIIIDGLDHIGRIKERYLDTLYNKEDILTFLEKMEIPEGVALIVGSQPGQHLTNLKERFGAGNFMEVKGFTEEESKKYLEQFEINDTATSKNTIRSVIEKSNGLPLLLAYSVQANRDMSLEERLEIFENISKELPSTGGNVKVYYDELWKNIQSKPHTYHYARLLSLIDFPASEELLENVISKSVRLGTSLDECMKPLVSVTVTTDKGIVFFHDSFGTHVRADNNFPAEDRAWYFENLFLYFKRVGILSSDLAYAKGIDFAFKAKLYNEILNIVTLKFVDDSAMMAFPQQQILSQADFAIRSAIHTKNIPVLVRNCVLKKYTEERFEFNYLFNEITRLYIKLKKSEPLQRLIFSNNSLNTDPATTIDLVSICLENDIDLPYRKIMDAWDAKLKNSKDRRKELKSVNRGNYAKIITKIYGLDYTLDWIKKNKGADFNESIFEGIGKFAPSHEIKQLIQKPNHEYGELVIILNSLLSTGDTNRASEVICSYLENDQFSTSYLLNLGIDLGVEQKLIEKECKIFVPKQPGVYPWDEEISELYQLEKSVKALSYCGNADQLEVIGSIKKYPLTSARLLQEMMFLLAVIEGKIASQKSISGESENILLQLERFVNHSTDDGVKPRDSDCTRLRYVAKYILKKLVEVYLIISNKPNFEKLVELIQKLNHKFEWHSVGCTFTLASTEHMIACFSAVMKKIPSDHIAKQKIMKTMETTDDIPTLTRDRVDYFLQIANIYIEYAMKEKAESAFNNAIFATHAYRYRKDLFMDEIHDIAIYLNTVDPSKSLDRAEDILQLVGYLWGVTDHAETKFIPANVTKELIRLKTKAGLKLLRQFNESGYDLSSIECLPFAVSSMKNAPLSLRWKLVTCANYERRGAVYNDENWLIDMKFELVKQAIDERNEKLANEIMENIREQITVEFVTCERDWKKDFQHYAKILKIMPLDLTDKLPTDSYSVDSKRGPSNLIRDGSTKEIIRQFEKLDGEKVFDAREDIEAIFNTKIKTMSEEEMDELTEFLTKSPKGISNSTCGDLLEKIARRYEVANKEKFLGTMFLAFDTYGWMGYGYPNITEWLVKAYNVDSKKTMDFLLESFARFSVEWYGPHGAIRRLAEFLYLTNQTEILESLYEELYQFCKTFFRTYTEESDEFRWLRCAKFETVDDKQIIQELIEMS